LYLQTLE